MGNAMYNTSTLKYYERYYNENLDLQKVHMQYGVKYFLYKRIYKNYNFFLLGNSPLSYVKTILEKQKKPSQFVVDCINSKHHNNFAYTTLIDYYNTPNLVKDSLIKHGIGDSFYISLSQKDYIEGFCFGLDINTHYTAEYLYRHIDSLKDFIALFKIKFFDPINNHSALCLSKHSPFLYNKDNASTDVLCGYKSCRGNTFSHREAQIIYYIHKRYSNKEIALALGISMRTVESYINNIGVKTGYHYKNEIKNILW